MRRPFRTIRGRITILATVVVAAVLVVAAVAIVVAQRQQLLAELDDSLSRTLDTAEAALVAGGVVAEAGDDRFVFVVDAVGAVVGGGGTEVDDAPIELPDPAVAPRELQVGDDTYRVATRPVTVDETTVFLVAGEEREHVDDSLRALVTALALAVPLAVAALAGVVWWLVGRTLRPVEAIRAEVDTIGGADLTRRVPVPDTDDEIAALAVTMNRMLERLEEAARRQHRFVADASHELRTPLTRIRTEIEVDQATGADLSATVSSVLEETERLEAMVSDLLLLASDGAATVALVDLDAVVAEVVARQEHPPDLTIDTAEVEALQVRGAESSLHVLVRNLVDNAVRHARHRVEVALHSDDEAIVLSVGDDGAGIPAQARGEIFEPFTRLDDARTAAAGGTGLGLALVRDIADRHGASVQVSDRDGGGTRVTVRFPS